MMGKHLTHQPREEGYVIVTLALLLTVLLGFSALAIDSGVLYSSRTSAQRIADSAALAGASTFIFQADAPQPATAEAHARAFAEGKDVLGDSVVNGEVTVRVDVANQRVTVDIDRVEETYMAQVIGFASADVEVSATAEAGTEIQGSDCVKPWFLPNSAFVSPVESDSTQDTMCDACDPASPLRSQLLFDLDTIPSSGIPQPTVYAQNLIAAKTLLRIKPQRPQQALEPGQFYPIRIGSSSGGSDYRDNITGCSGDPLACGDCVGSEPGNMIGPTTQGTQNLIGNPPDYTLDSATPVRITDGSIFTVNAPARVIIPIWNICTDILTASCPGSDPTGFCPGETLSDGGANVQLSIIGYADIFVVNVSNSTGVDAYLLGLSACKLSSGTPVPTPVDSSSVLGFPLRLVRP